MSLAIITLEIIITLGLIPKVFINIPAELSVAGIWALAHEPWPVGPGPWAWPMGPGPFRRPTVVRTAVRPPEGPRPWARGSKFRQI